MDDSTFLDAPSTFNDDHVASWATMGLDSSAVLSRAASSTLDTMEDSVQDTHTVFPGDVDDPLAVRHTARGASPKGASRSRAVLVDRSILDSMTHFPRDKAAHTLGLSATTFKKVCRRAGLKGWPYRRPLLGTTLEGDVPMTLSRGSSTPNWQTGQAKELLWQATRLHSTPSAFHETPHLHTSRASSSPGCWISTFSPAAAQQTAPQPTTPLRHVNLSSPSFSSSLKTGVLSREAETQGAWAPWLHSSSSFATYGGSFSYLAPAQAPTLSLGGSTQRATPEQSTHVVDAVLDYLDTLSSGCCAAHDINCQTGQTSLAAMAALHLSELEAVVEGLDLEG